MLYHKCCTEWQISLIEKSIIFFPWHTFYTCYKLVLKHIGFHCSQHPHKNDQQWYVLHPRTLHNLPEAWFVWNCFFWVVNYSSYKERFVSWPPCRPQCVHIRQDCRHWKANFSKNFFCVCKTSNEVLHM